MDELNQKSMEGMEELSPSDLQLGDYVSLHTNRVLDKRFYHSKIANKRFYPARVIKISDERIDLYILNDELIREIPTDKFVNLFSVDMIDSGSKIYELPIFLNVLYMLGATDKKLNNDLFYFKYTLFENENMKTVLCIEEEKSNSWINTYIKNEKLREISPDLVCALSNEIKIQAINSTRLLQHFLRLFKPNSLTEELIKGIEEHLSAYDEDGDSWNRIIKIKKL